MVCTPPKPSEHNTPLPLSGSVYRADSNASSCPSYSTAVISTAHRQPQLHKQPAGYTGYVTAGGGARERARKRDRERTQGKRGRVDAYQDTFQDGKCYNYCSSSIKGTALLMPVIQCSQGAQLHNSEHKQEGKNKTVYAVRHVCATDT